jgi:hypothetical protein
MAATRKRILYSSKLVKYGTDIVKGVQSCTYGFEFTRTDVNAFGKLSVYDRLLTSTPTVSTELQLLAGGNDGLIGRDDILATTTTDARDITIGLSTEVIDGDYKGGGSMIKTRGNFVSSASIEASVGAFALLNIGFEGTGMKVEDGTVGAVPTDAPARTQEHLKVDFKGYGTAAQGGGTSASPVGLYGVSGIAQSVNMTVNIARELLEKFEHRYAEERLVQFPTNATLTLEGLDTANKIDYDTLAEYSQKTNNSAMLRNVDFKINEHATDSLAAGNDIYNYGLSGAVADSVTFNGGIGDNHTISMVLTAPVGASNDTVHNFMWHVAVP